MTRNHEDNKLIEGAIVFLVTAIEKSGKNPKPVIRHSLRMAEYLYNKGYGENIVIGAILHDILEDTAVELDEIKKKFGIKVAKLVEANSFNKSVEDKVTQYKEMFERCLSTGREALIIKATDILDNSNYYHLAETEEAKEMLMQKMQYFIDLSIQSIKNDVVWRDLNKQYKFLRTKR